MDFLANPNHQISKNFCIDLIWICSSDCLLHLKSIVINHQKSSVSNSLDVIDHYYYMHSYSSKILVVYQEVLRQLVCPVAYFLCGQKQMMKCSQMALAPLNSFSSISLSSVNSSCLRGKLLYRFLICEEYEEALLGCLPGPRNLSSWAVVSMGFPHLTQGPEEEDTSCIAIVFQASMKMFYVG
eukprot:Gb_16841 [translate_table: standard]